MSVTKYCCGFLFTDDGEHVLLIEKNRPDWQRGKLNGVGGKVEPGELPIEAMSREFWEEARLNCLTWVKFAVLTGVDFEVHFFSARCGWAQFSQAEDGTDEMLHVLPVADVATDRRVIPNLKVLIPLALDDSGIRKPVMLTQRVAVNA